MLSDKTGPASKSPLKICVDSREGGDIYGRLYTMCTEAPLPFHSTPSLLLQMERIYDGMAFPLSATEHRSFGSGKKPLAMDTRKGLSDLQEYDITYQKGEKATFIVEVAFRQNSTWQGSVVWTDGDRRRSFRSALELIRLIDSATGIELRETEEWEKAAD